MATEQSHQTGLHTGDILQNKPNPEATYEQATFTPTKVTTYTPIPMSTHTSPTTANFTQQDKSSTPDKALDFVGVLDIDTSIPLDLPNLPTLHDTSSNTNGTYNKIDSSSNNDSTSTTLANTTDNNLNINDTTNSAPSGKGKKKGEPSSKRGRKPAQDPPYTKLYKQPWLDGWATCRRLALEYIEETKLLALRTNASGDLRRLPSQTDLSNGNAQRAWTPMELILARAFLKEADLVNTSTKRGVVIREGLSIEQMSELISKSVLPSTHAVHYAPKERKKDPNEPNKDRNKPKKPKKQKTEPPAALPPSQLSYLPTLSIPKDPIPFWKCE